MPEEALVLMQEMEQVLLMHMKDNMLALAAFIRQHAQMAMVLLETVLVDLEILKQVGCRYVVNHRRPCQWQHSLTRFLGLQKPIKIVSCKHCDWFI